jgi:hypothetical protein
VCQWVWATTSPAWASARRPPPTPWSWTRARRSHGYSAPPASCHATASLARCSTRRLRAPTPPCRALRHSAASSRPTLNPSACSVSNVCVYQASYGDQSFSVGYQSKDTVSFGSGGFPDFYFSCGQDDEGCSAGPSGSSALHATSSHCYTSSHPAWDSPSPTACQHRLRSGTSPLDLTTRGSTHSHPWRRARSMSRSTSSASSGSLSSGARW